MNQKPADKAEIMDYGKSENSQQRASYLRAGSLVAMGLIIAFIVIWIVPSIMQQREIEHRMQCASNLRQIGQEMLLYANDHGGDLPDTLQTLVVNSNIPPQAFVCPSAGDVSASGATPQQIANNLNSGNHLSYVYLGGALNVRTTPAEAILVYESLSNHARDRMLHGGSNVLFGDGHCEWLAPTDIQKIEAQIKAGSNPVIRP